MIHFRRRRVLDAEELRRLLDLTEHQVRALISNNDDNDDTDDVPHDFYYARRPRCRAWLSPHREAL